MAYHATLMHLTFKQLTAFASIAESGSFSESAAELHLTGPALTIVIQSLEERVGFKVFDRTTRTVRLTQAGQALLPHVERLLSEFDSITHAVSDIRQKRTGVVRVAAPPMFNCTILPQIYIQFEEMFPSIEVLPVDTPSERLEESLLRGSADICVGPERALNDEIVATPLFSSSMALACSIHHPFANRKSVKWKELQGETLLLVDRGTLPLMAKDSQYQVVFARHHQVGSATTALALASNGKGVMIIPSFGRPLAQSFNTVMVPLIEPEAFRQVMLYHNQRYTMSPATQQLAENLPGLLADLHPQ